MRTLILILLAIHSLTDGADAANLIIIRHAQAQHNIDHQVNSNPAHVSYHPSYLTSIGERQAKITAEQLLDKGINQHNVSLTLVSPLPRAMQTAAVLADRGVIARASIVMDPRLTAMQLGDKEGKEAFDIEGQARYHKQAKSLGGEREQDVLERATQVLKELGSQNIAGNVVIVTHATTAREIVRLMTGKPQNFDTGEAVILPRNTTTHFLNHQ